MRRYILYIISFVVAIFSSDYLMAESWTGQTKGTFTLDGNVNISEMVVLTGDLTITADESWTIKATKDMWCVFQVKENQTLTIKGLSGAVITIDGGGDFSELHFTQNMDRFSPSAIGGVKLEEAIFSRGGLYLQNVTICNVNGYKGTDTENGDKYGGAICIKGNSTGFRTSTIDNCTISNCATYSGSAVYFNCEKTFTKGSEDCKVTISNSTIENCFSSNVYGGTIRTSGSAKSNLYLTNTTVKNNFSNGAGGALYWNGAGNSDTKCFIDGCTFEGNIAGDMGGALMLETSFEFTGNTSYVKNNKVIRDDGTIDDLPIGIGGGIIIPSYTGKAIGTKDLYEFDYTLSQNLIVSGNSAPVGGGGVAFAFAWFDVSSADGVEDINLNIQLVGAEISGNSTDGNGAGIYVWNNTSEYTDENKGKIDIQIHLDNGDLINNKAGGNGAGIYTYNANISTSDDGHSEALNIKKNVSAGNGGGIYVDGGDIFLVGQATLSENSADGNGGVAYADQGSINIQYCETTIQNNKAVNGGAFYVSGGDIITGEGLISENIASSDGGAFYLNGGKVSVGKMTMRKNEAVNGGAIALHNGQFQISPEGRIMNNTAKYGGGLYVNNESGTLTCDGGSFDGNSADYGGGIYATGQIDLVLAANVYNNRAKNGGGIYADGGVELLFGNGLIVSNQAAEVGGGIYLSNGQLVFTDTQNFGIYNNSADVEAADIYASGSNTQIVIPNAKTMDLKGFDVPGSELYWVYDNEGQRYEEALWNLDIEVESLILDFDEAPQMTISNMTICLDLGYDLVFVTLEATGLAEDDHAEIEMLYPKATQGGVEKVPYRSVLFTGVDGSNSSVVIGIPSGDWYLEGTDLGVKYNPPTITPSHGYNNSDNSINITREKNSEITIAYTPKQESIQHVVIYTKSLSNIMTPGGGN